jgi:hypothetical protein
MQREGAVPESFVLVQAAECHQHRKLAKRDGGEAVREREAARKDVPLTRSHLHEMAADDIGENCNRHLQRSSRARGWPAWLGRSGTRSPARPPPGEHNHEQSVLRDAGRANLKDAQPSSHYTQDEDREAAVQVLLLKAKFCAAKEGRLVVLGLDGTSQLSGLTPDMVGEIAQAGLTGTYEHYRDNLDTTDLTTHVGSCCNIGITTCGIGDLTWKALKARGHA